jgi:hypothetical protein
MDLEACSQQKLFYQAGPWIEQVGGRSRTNMSSESTETRPLRFTSETLNALLVITLAISIFVPVVCVFFVATKDILAGFRRWRLKKKIGKGSGNDIESDAGIKTDLELCSDEKNGGLCELEQPRLPELSGVGILEMWDEGCAREMDGKTEPTELDAFNRPIRESKASTGTRQLEAEGSDVSPPN